MGDTSGSGFMYWLSVIATFFPTIAAGSRRLHDVNKSGWLQLLAITIIGIILILLGVLKYTEYAIGFSFVGIGFICVGWAFTALKGRV